MRAFFGWLGGKSRLAKTIVERLPKESGLCYVELFVGAGWVFFRKERDDCEVLNDVNGELVNLFRVVQNHPAAFKDCFAWAVNSREHFERLRATAASNLTDVQRAARYYYLLRHAFANVPQAFNFGYTTQKKTRGALPRDEHLRAVHERLSAVNIERLDFEDCLRRYDRTHTVFYVDPPYWSPAGVKGYGVKFALEEHERLALALRSVKGRFLLSVNDAPEIAALYPSTTVEKVTTKYTVARRKEKDGAPLPRTTELLIRNY